ncbi:MAG: response regulator [Candidatus Omnitrophica bacterium]|nr:response regulator [Candidatus Omnitrophota bacterium]
MNKTKKKKIVTIDDEPDFVAMIKNYFGLRGYEVHTALRGVIGLELIEKEKPGVVLIDLKLPGIDGDTILQQIKRIHPRAKTIMITAFKDEGQIQKKLMNQGLYAYFEKPITSFKELEEAVSKAMREGKL